MNLKKEIADIVGNRVVKAVPLGRNTTMTLRVLMDDDRHFIVKIAKEGEMDEVDSETLMLEHIQKVSKLPTPTIVHAKQGLLLLEDVAHSATWMTAESEESVATHLAEFHRAPADYCGFEIDTSVSGLHQSNDVNMVWREFYAEKRLRWAAQLCADCGHMSVRLVNRVDKLIDILDTIIPNDIRPSLLHGDLWKGNILVEGSQVKAFIDPALYYGHFELDLAFMTMFGKISDRFWQAYHSVNKLDKEFQTDRKWVYLIWPILVHIRLKGERYVPHLDRMLTRFGV